MNQDADIEVDELLPRHRDAMLDLILTWASIDGALGALVAEVCGFEWVDAAELIGRDRGSKKIQEVIAVVRNLPDGQAAAKKLRKIKKRYEKHSRVRDHIAHSRCIGACKLKKDIIVFLKFERVGEEQLAMYEVPLEEMREAQNWGKDFLKLLFQWTRTKG